METKAGAVGETLSGEKWGWGGGVGWRNMGLWEISIVLISLLKGRLFGSNLIVREKPMREKKEINEALSRW